MFPKTAAGLAEILAHGVGVPDDVEEAVPGPQGGGAIRAHRIL